MIGYRAAVVKAVVSTSLLVGACGGSSGTSPSVVPVRTGIGSTPSAAAVATSPTLATSHATQPATPPVVDTTAPATADGTLEPAGGWSQLEIANGPSAREDHTWTVAADGDAAYLFGGRAKDGPSSELWKFDLAASTWTRLEPRTDGPGPRFGHTATWVPEVGLVVWSGQGGSGFFDDIWRYDPDANAWEELPSSGDVPPARYGSCASLGPDGHLWVSHGFTDAGRFRDTRSYEFASGTWTERTPAGKTPIERCLHDCFWSSSGRLVLYGGQTNGVAALGDIWSYDPQAAAWTEGPESAAPPRQLYSLVVIPGGAVVFGGGSADGGFLGDMWSIDPAQLRMNSADVPGQAPSARGGAALIDAARRALLFGGKNADGLLGDLWELSRPVP